MSAPPQLRITRANSQIISITRVPPVPPVTPATTSSSPTPPTPPSINHPATLPESATTTNTISVASIDESTNQSSSLNRYRGGGKVGRKKWQHRQIDSLLNLVESRRPMGNYAWESCATAFNDTITDIAYRRNGTQLREKFIQLTRLDKLAIQM